MSRDSQAKNIVGRRIAEARGLSHPPLTQDSLSGKLALLGVPLDRSAIAKIEGNHRYVLDYELKALAQALGVQLEWLFGGKQ